MINSYSIQHTGRVTLTAVLTILCFIGLQLFVHGQGDGARMYLKGMVGTNVLPVVCNSTGSNANPLDPAHTVEAGSKFLSTMATPMYGRMFSLFNRAAIVMVILPLGRIAGEVNVSGKTSSSTGFGFGDPTVQLDLNIIGPKAIKDIPAMLRYKPGFSLDFLGSVSFPVGNYDPESPTNIGQNRWYGRIGFPVICQIGRWVPGKRGTIEVLPVLYIYGANNNYMGQKKASDPMLQIEGHITRDFMERLWGSLNVIWYYGAASVISKNDSIVQTTDKLNNIGVGGTLGYQLNDNLQMTLSYTATISAAGSVDLRMDTFRVTLVYVWHSLLEGLHRLKSEE